jgi:hypothetical protein
MVMDTMVMVMDMDMDTVMVVMGREVLAIMRKKKNLNSSKPNFNLLI